MVRALTGEGRGLDGPFRGLGVVVVHLRLPHPGHSRPMRAHDADLLLPRCSAHRRPAMTRTPTG